MSKKTDEVCGYCGIGVSVDAVTRIESLYDPIGARRMPMADPDAKVRPVTIAVCGECVDLKRFTDRTVYAKILGGPEKVERFTDTELQSIGRGLITPIYQLRANANPQKPWAHVDAVELRIELAAAAMKLNAPEPETHPSRRGCGVCSVSRAEEWEPKLIGGWPICGDCGSTGLVSGNLAPAKRLRAIFAGEIHGLIPLAPGDLKAWMETSDCAENPNGYPKAWGYITDTDREALKRFAANVAWTKVPSDWVTKYRHRKAPAKGSKVSAVGL